MELAVTASGMVTPVGFNARSSLAALRAGIRNVHEVNLWDGECGEYLAAGKVPLPQWWVGVGKLAELAAPAIRECLQAALPEDPLAIREAIPTREPGPRSPAGDRAPPRPRATPGVEDLPK
jgi:3-oxoacyl-[acyl-carrier-protein] synthase I